MCPLSQLDPWRDETFVRCSSGWYWGRQPRITAWNTPLPCKSCAHRARRLFTRLGLGLAPVGPNQRSSWIFETPDVAVLIPSATASRLTTRSTVLMFVARFLFGRSRTRQAPTRTEVWRLRKPRREDIPAVIKTYHQPDTCIRAFEADGCLEIRRAPWLRVIGPIDERVVIDERGEHPMVAEV